jgi:lactoylglutathione lyase
MNSHLLHTMIRVRDLKKSVHFYSQILGMQEFRRQEYPGGRFTLCFLGYEEGGHQIELTHNWDRETDYPLGEGYGHLAIGNPDIYALSKKIREAGGEVVREPGPMKHGSTHIAFVRDPDGYAIELIQRET